MIKTLFLMPTIILGNIVDKINVKNYDVELLDASVDGEELALETIKQKNIWGEIIGTVTFIILWNAFAPSILAAS